jgi:hypothetical protein
VLSGNRLTFAILDVDRKWSCRRERARDYHKISTRCSTLDYEPTKASQRPELEYD